MENLCKNDFTQVIQQSSYDFLRDSNKINGKLCYLTVSGSYAYGTNNESSDLDIRGVAIENKDSLLLGKGMEQYEDRDTDTVIYGLQKFVAICRGCNPNAIELLGTLPKHVLYIDEAGTLLRDNAEIFSANAPTSLLPATRRASYDAFRTPWHMTLTQKRRRSGILRSPSTI